MVEILTAVLGDGLSAVEAACAEALREGVHSADVVLNILARQREPPAPVPLLTLGNLRLRYEPVAECAPLRQPEESPMMEHQQILATTGELKLFGIKAAYNEIIKVAVKRSHEPQQIVGDLLQAERSARSRRARFATR